MTVRALANVVTAILIIAAVVFLGTRDYGARLRVLQGEIEHVGTRLGLEQHQRQRADQSAEHFASTWAARSLRLEQAVNRLERRVGELEGALLSSSTESAPQAARFALPVDWTVDSLPEDVRGAITQRIEEHITVAGIIEWNVNDLLNHLGEIIELPEDVGSRGIIIEELSVLLRNAQSQLDIAAYEWQGELQRAVDRLEHTGAYTEIGPQDTLPLPPAPAGEYISHVVSRRSRDMKQVFFITRDVAPELFERSAEKEIASRLLGEAVLAVDALTQE